MENKTATSLDETLQFEIHGMSCAGCVRNVEQALVAVPGVNGASVNFAGQSATVVGTAQSEDLIAAVNDAGYEARMLTSLPIDDEAQQISNTLRHSLLRSASALLLAAGLMGDMWFGFLPATTVTAVWLPLGLVTLALMWFTGGHFFKGAISAARHGTTTMDTLVALGTATAWCYSMIVVLLPELLPEQSRHQFFEAALFVIGFVNLGKALELNARSRSSLAVRKLFDLTPREVVVLDEHGNEQSMPLALIQTGALIRIRPGDVVPVDGVIREGGGAFDEALLTGESAPVLKYAGDEISAGTTCLDSSMVVEAVGVGSDTRLAAIAKLVQQAQDSKPRIARLVDRVTAFFVPAVLLMAALTVGLWWMLGPEPRLSFALVTGMSVLIIACPCALGLAVPMSVMIGLGRGAEQGLLIRNSEVLQAASELDVLVLDKTGTLTLGEPQLTDIKGLSESQLAMVQAVERQSSHPLAEAIVRELGAHVDDRIVVESFRSHAGGGVSARVATDQVLLGSQRFMEAHGLTVSEPLEIGSVVFVAINQKIEGYLILRDEPRKEAREAISLLHNRGVRTVMLTGDRPRVADVVSRLVEIEEVHAGVTPEGKLEFISTLQAEGLKVGMVGDGINDAAALAKADVSFAMGKGADVALEAADITLLHADLRGLDAGIHLSSRVLGNMRQNLFAAFAYNVLLIPVAAGVLYPFSGQLLNPALAGLAMAMSSVSVVLNAGRLRFV